MSNLPNIHLTVLYILKRGLSLLWIFPYNFYPHEAYPYKTFNSLLSSNIITLLYYVYFWNLRITTYHQYNAQYIHNQN